MNPKLTYAVKLLTIWLAATAAAVGLGIITTAIWPSRPYLGVGVGITFGGIFAYIITAF